MRPRRQPRFSSWPLVRGVSSFVAFLRAIAVFGADPLAGEESAVRERSVVGSARLFGCANRIRQEDKTKEYGREAKRMAWYAMFDALSLEEPPGRGT